MALAEKGKIDVDDSVVSLLPGDVEEDLHVTDGVDYTPKITVWHLLTHTSGLPDWLEDVPQGEKA